MMYDALYDDVECTVEVIIRGGRKKMIHQVSETSIGSIIDSHFRWCDWRRGGITIMKEEQFIVAVFHYSIVDYLRS